MEAAELMGGHDQVCLLLDTPRAGSKGHRCFVSNKENLDEDKARQLVETARKALAREGRFPGMRRWKDMAQQTFAVGHWVVQEGTSAREAVEVLLCLTHTENCDVFHELERILREFPEQERNSANERPSLILQSEYLRNAFTAKFSTPRRTDPEPRSGTLKSKKENRKMKTLFVLSLLAAAMVVVCALIHFLFPLSDGEPEVEDEVVTHPTPDNTTLGRIAHLEKHDPGRKQLEQWELKSGEKSAENQMKELKGFLREFNKQLKVLAETITSHPKSEAFNQYRHENGESLFPLITYWKKKIEYGEINLELEIQTTDKDYNEDDKACMNNLIKCIGQVSDDSLSDLKAEEMETKTWNSLGLALRKTKRKATEILQETPDEYSAATRDVFDDYIRLMDMISNRVDDIIAP